MGRVASSVGVGDRFTAVIDSVTKADVDVVRQSGDDYALFAAVQTEYRTYVYTYVSQFGDVLEESAPSPASEIVTVRFGQNVRLTGFITPPSGKYNYKKIRVYRSVAGSNSASFLFVGEFDIDNQLTSKVFDDVVKAEGLGEPCPSFNWSEPPEALKGLCVMANGIYCGFNGRELFFSEPFMPHAWDLGNAVSTEHKIVGIKAFGQSLYVATEGNPYIVSGVAPEQMTSNKLPIFEPCVSKRSIAVDQYGSYYASPNGIVSIGPGGADNITRNLFTMTEWQKYNPKSMLGAAVDGRYYLFYKTDISPIKTGGLVFDKYTQQSPLSEIDLYVDAAHVEPTESALYVFVDDEIKKWEGDLLNGLAFQWTSKLFILPRPLCFGALQVEADFADIDVAELYQQRTAAAMAQNQATFAANANLKGVLNKTSLNTYSTNGSILIDIPQVVDDRYVTVVIYADGVQKASIDIKNRNMYRLPGGYKADRWELKVMGNIPVRHIKIAESGRELSEL